LESYIFRLRCGWCGGKCCHVTGGNFSSFEARSVARCNDCGTRWVVSVQMTDPSGGRSKHTPARVASMAKARAAKWSH